MAKATAAQTASGKSIDKVKNNKPAKSAKQGKPAKPNIFVRFTNYLKDVRTELRRTVWPTRDEVLRSSMVVVATLVFFIVFLIVVDFIVSNAVLAVSNL
jgi:preprotein translocase subunit SecE